MIEIIGTELNQWDTGRSVSVTGIDASHVHFANQGDSKAVIMELANSQALIPDYLFQTGKQLCVYAVANGVTIERKMFSVKKRERPENYIYEDDQRNYIYVLISSAEIATANANEAAENANSAAESAGVATKNATEATAGANTASNNANQAAKNANEAADKAAHTAKSLMVIGEAEGTSIALDDSIDQFLVGLRAFGKTTQDGTPTPDAPVELESVENPVVGLYGKNLFTSYAESTKTENGITFTVNSDGSITINGTATGTAQFNMFALYELPPSIRPGETYMISGATSATSIHVFELQDNWVHKFSTTSKTTFVLSDDAKGVLIRYAVQPNVSVNNLRVYPMLRLASVADDTYEQSKPAQTIMLTRTLHGIPVTSGGNYTDANGQQWICDEIDLARGVYVQRLIQRTISDFSSANSVAPKNGHTEGYISFGVLVSEESGGLCDKFPYAPAGSFPRFGLGGSIIYFTIEGEYTKEEWIDQLTVISPTFVAALRTPIETPLSEEELAAYASLHTYRGYTTVSNDASAYMDLEYVMDAKKYIDSQISGYIHPATVE